MIIIRYWLKQLFKFAYFENAYHENIIFNPKMIDLLFDNDKTILKQFHVQHLELGAGNDIDENIFEFALKHFAIYENLAIVLTQNNIIEKYIDILFNIIINEGNKLPKVNFGCFKSSRIYDLIVEVRVL